MQADLGGRLGHADAIGGLADAEARQFHVAEQATLARRQRRQQAGDIASHSAFLDILFGKEFAGVVQRHGLARADPAKVIEQLVSRHAPYPGRERLGGIVGMTLEMNSQKNVLH